MDQEVVEGFGRVRQRRACSRSPMMSQTLAAASKAARVGTRLVIS